MLATNRGASRPHRSNGAREAGQLTIRFAYFLSLRQACPLYPFWFGQAGLVLWEVSQLKDAPSVTWQLNWPAGRIDEAHSALSQSRHRSQRDAVRQVKQPAFEVCGRVAGGPRRRDMRCAMCARAPWKRSL